jgi:hypothetical protein
MKPMADLASISAMLSSIKAATDIAKAIRDSSITLEQVEYKLQLAELLDKLVDTKIQIASIQEIIREKDDRIRKLEKEAEMRGKMIYEAPYYWLDTGSRKDGPYCQQCYDSVKKLLRLQKYDNNHWRCMTCDNSYVR